jgi:putative FmdB family regulatory protein
MPIYEYQCTACGHQLEAFQSMSEAPLADCPACHQAKLQKLVSAAGFQLKGTGWYATDFKNKGKPEPKKDSSSSEGGQSDSSAPISKDSKTDSAT